MNLRKYRDYLFRNRKGTLPVVVIIDYGMGNLKSVYNALKKIDCDCKISSDVNDIKAADGLILPGVGAFPDCMDNLKKSNLIILENHLHHCVKEAFENDNGDEKIEEIIKILEKVMSK